MHSSLRVDYTEIKAMPLKSQRKALWPSYIACVTSLYQKKHRLAIPNAASHPMFEVY